MLQNSMILVFVIPFILYRTAEYLNFKLNQNKLNDPKKIELIRYHSSRLRLAWIESSLSLLMLFGFLYLGIFDTILVFAQDLQISYLPNLPSTTPFLFVLILSFLQGLIQLPFSIYSTFVIEERFGFNTTRVQTFIADQVKGVLVGLVIGALLYALFIYALQNFILQWLSISITLIFFQFVLAWLAPLVLLPIFMKLTPLPTGELSEALAQYQKNLGFKMDGVWVSDASKRSKKTNAFFTGFGKFKRLVLFDTLIANHSSQEIVAVIAHEVGHFKLGHIWKGLLYSTIGIFVFMALTHLLVSSGLTWDLFQIQSHSLIPTEASLPLNWILSLYLLQKSSFFVSLFTQFRSRKQEYEADRFSAQSTQNPQALIQALTKLEQDNKSFPYSHPLYTALFASHPTVSDRVKALDALKLTPVQR